MLRNRARPASGATVSREAGVRLRDAGLRRGAGLGGRPDSQVRLLRDLLGPRAGRARAARPRGGADHPGGASSPAKGPCTGFPRWGRASPGSSSATSSSISSAIFYGEKVLSLPLTRKFLTQGPRGADQGVFPPPRGQDPDPGPVRRRVPDRGVPDGGHPPPADAQAVPDRPLRRVDQHAPDVLAWPTPSPARSSRGSRRPSITSRRPSAWLVAVWLLHRFVKARLRAGERVGPPVLVSPDDVPLPPDDLHPRTDEIPVCTIARSPLEPEPSPVVPVLPPVVDSALAHHPPLESMSGRAERSSPPTRRSDGGASIHSARP